MPVRRSVRFTVLIVVACALVAQTTGSVTSAPGSSHGRPELAEPKVIIDKSPETCCLTKAPRPPYPGPYGSTETLWEFGLDAINLIEEGRRWEATYLVYQELISEGSAPLLFPNGGYLESSDGTPVCLVHGRSDVQDNADLIRNLGSEYPGIPPVLVAASIAEQASDVERIFGLDIWEKAALAFPGWDDMSIGIAQLRHTEAISLGLGSGDLFDPETAVRGMYSKLQSADQQIDLIQDPASPLPLTDRYMLLSLAQNNPGSIYEYMQTSSDWKVLLSRRNNARVMRYYLVHLDWLLANGWSLPGGVDLDLWRQIVFTPVQEDVAP